MTDKPIISVIIVTYNRLDVLKNCLESLRTQTLSKDKYEVIVVDDGSKDGTKEFLENLDWGGQPHIDIHFNQHKGCCAARNFGVEKARGKYVSFTDDDCVPESQWLEKVIQTFDSDSEIGVVGSVTKVAFTNKAFEPLNAALRKSMPKEVIRDKFEVEITEGQTGFVGLRPFSACNLHVKRKDFLELGGFDINIWPGDDVDFLYRFLMTGGKMAHRKDIYVDHYERDDLWAMFKRWFNFGKFDSEMVGRYLRSKLSIEINVFHGIMSYRFINIPFPISVYFQLNIFKVFVLLGLLALGAPKLGLTLFFGIIAAFFIKQKNPRGTLSLLFYSVVMELSYSVGSLWTSLRKGILCI